MFCTLVLCKNKYHVLKFFINDLLSIYNFHKQSNSSDIIKLLNIVILLIVNNKSIKYHGIFCHMINTRQKDDKLPGNVQF